jgi:hypothetical protein
MVVSSNLIHISKYAEYYLNLQLQKSGFPLFLEAVGWWESLIFVIVQKF